ncbi:glycoside hydrolase family 25 protein [Corynebacterium freiburgense]|uniref:glycoside hydrolase family 25 protein n=1 Tax=Corynebacterium freiburgense TaxID=556548 RepID=UPI0003FF2F2A|nr:GH25 family lysozyme [Corynebacterium freiburgense]WJZ01387.1 Lysozyme M1 precursor [Corynebacterium freiburgense]
MMFSPKALTRNITGIFLVVALVIAFIAVPKAKAIELGAPSGVDVSSWQHPGGEGINWKMVQSDGYSYAFIKATEGINYLNPHFASDSRQAMDAGMIIGSYHLGRPGVSATAQAAAYAAVLASQPQPSLPPVLDIEYNDGVGPAQMQAWVREFVKEIELLTGRKPIIYTYRYFWEQQMGNTDEFKDYPLWMAAYQNSAPTTLPGGWDYMTFWQRSSTGRVAGINYDTDLNLFNGSRGELDDFVKGNHVQLGNLLNPSMSIDKMPALEVMSKENPELVKVILAVAAGAVTISALIAVARDAGLDVAPAEELAKVVQHQVDTGKLPVEDLEIMLDRAKYSIGDLIRLLEAIEAQQA